MRLELAGSLVRPDPKVISYNAHATFVPVTYLDLGYTDFEVICIGAGGGMGGGIDTANTGTQLRSYGGAGGGGGIHRVKGFLSELPSAVDVVIGVGGAVGIEHNFDPALTTDGADGGYSAFNGVTCQASGGKGGKRVQSNSPTVTTQANGGDGGKGGRLIAGGGAVGGVAGTPSVGGPGVAGTPGADGGWDGSIGAGGGGGAGGVAKYGSGGTTLNRATAGGMGSYDVNDTSVYGSGNPAVNDPETGATFAIPGGASGAKATPLNLQPTVYGKSSSARLPGQPGIVVVRLTAP